MDMGDFGANVTVQFFQGATLLGTVSLPTIAIDKPGSSEAMWVGYYDGNKPFNKIKISVEQTTEDPDFFDVVGFDDFVIGMAPACTPV